MFPSRKICRLRVLVVIASYGLTNDEYLSHLIDEYRSMPYSVDIVVLSNIPKELGRDVQVVVGLPTNNPRSLPFGHKQVFVDRLNDYDLFIYSEDDTLITETNVEAFLRVSAILRDDEVAGFLRFETDQNGRLFYPDVHRNYHWEVRSVRSRAEYSFAFFTNEHSACYMLTQLQLQRAIQFGGFLVGIHRGRYGLLETAATDVYTQCGFTKLICISHFDDFVVHHLPNRYIGKLGLDGAHFREQIRTLLKIAAEGNAPTPLLDTHSQFKASDFAKDYYEPVRAEFVDLIPENARTVLSIGCGWGATEEALLQCGKRVTAIPLDPVISVCAEARGIEVIRGELTAALTRIRGGQYDCVVMSNILHLVEDPVLLLNCVAALLSKDAVVVTAVPNLANAQVLWRKIRREPYYATLGNYRKSGVHFSSQVGLRKWLGRAGLRVTQVRRVLPKTPRTEKARRYTLELLNSLLASEIFAVATRL